MVLCCNRQGGGYLSLSIALGVASCREIGALTEASGTFEDIEMAMGHLAGSISVKCQSRKRSWCFAYLSASGGPRRQRRVDRERPRAERSRCLIGSTQLSTLLPSSLPQTRAHQPSPSPTFLYRNTFGSSFSKSDPLPVRECVTRSVH